jgi:hypothetical protein
MTVTWPLPPLWVSKVQPCFAKKRRSSAAHICCITRLSTYQIYRGARLTSYFHPWRLHDLVMWDNPQTMYRARRLDDRNEIRDVRRTTLAGDVATIEQVA